ncbi:hypothetical protein [Leptospira sp. GIMC2001]|uniref:hypothetical protein n=1 Tax=Leptospira sp. GIMC2001 TaxID=1513297 RepID=UPI00234A085E|nr:hypothetical protein [Leptospira sp. GIMC2001]WCL49476.1 hypothetical protein O4O04_19635 [Leptospira sp. GIMC2001]
MKFIQNILTLSLLCFLLFSQCGGDGKSNQKPSEKIEITEDNALEEAEKLILELESL